MRIAICDDEKILRESLYALVIANLLGNSRKRDGKSAVLSRFPAKLETISKLIRYKNQNEDCHVDLYDSGNALLDANKEYDIYFLDIQMPGIDGMKTAAQIRQTEKSRESVIIFITALKEYMANAFDVKAFHYLVKPLDEEKFSSVFSRAISDYRKANKNADKHILIKSGSDYHKIYLKEISYVESQGKKVIIHMGNKSAEYYGKMAELENTLGDSFFRSHRCYLVNMSYISRYNTTSIWLTNGAEVFLAQKKFQEFVKAYLLFAKSGGLTNE